MNTHYHDQISSVQAAFLRDIRSLVIVIEDIGNPFEKESTDLLVLDSKEITDYVSVQTVQHVRTIGQDQFQAFARECLFDRSKSFHDVIHRNKLFRSRKPKSM